MDSDNDDTPPLLRAAYAGDVHALRRAIANGADVNVEGVVDDYINAVAKAGGYARYERAHCERLAAIFMPKPETGKGRRRSKRRRSPLHGLPVEVMQNIVSILWDCGGH